MTRTAIRRVARLAAIVISCAAVLALASAGPATALPQMCKYEVIARAWSAIGCEYTWGGESWTPPGAGQPGGYGPDCSGLCLKSWETTRTMWLQEEDGAYQTAPCEHSLAYNATINPRWSSYDFARTTVPSPYDWSKISISQRAMGDVAAYYTGSYPNGHGHAVIIHYPNGDGSGDTVIEAPGKCYDVRQTVAKDLISNPYTFDRRANGSGYGTNVIVLDNETAARSGPYPLFQWRPGSAPGGQAPWNSEYRVLLINENGHARWTPVVESAGNYRIYVWYPSAASRATQVHYKLNFYGGSRDVYISQRVYGSSWVQLTLQGGPVWLLSGYSQTSGSVDLWSGYGADGNVALDAIKFVKQ